MPPEPKKSSHLATIGGVIAKHGAILISVISAIVSGFSLYFSSLRGPEIIVRAGDMVAVSISPDGNFELFTTISFSNSGVRPGIISSVSLACTGVSLPDSGKEPNLFPVYLASLTPDNGTAQIAGIISPEIVKGGDQITRHILFLSKIDQLPDQQIRSGNYACRVLGRSEQSRSMIELDKFKFTVTDIDAQVLRNCPRGNRYLYTDRAGVKAEVLRLLDTSACQPRSPSYSGK